MQLSKFDVDKDSFKALPSPKKFDWYSLWIPEMSLSMNPLSLFNSGDFINFAKICFSSSFFFPYSFDYFFNNPFKCVWS